MLIVDKSKSINTYTHVKIQTQYVQNAGRNFRQVVTCLTLQVVTCLILQVVTCLTLPLALL